MIKLDVILEINEAIQDGKTVKDFLEDLRKKYPNMEKFNSNNVSLFKNIQLQNNKNKKNRRRKKVIYIQ